MRRRLTALAAVLCGGLALLQLAAAQGNSQRPTTTAAAAPSASSPAGATTATGAQSALVARGHALFVSSCASCHGMSAQGIRGRAPSLHGVGAMAADFYLQTGRMPLPSPRVQPLRTKPAFPPRQIDALVAYVGSFGGPPIPVVHPSRGSLADGQRLFGLGAIVPSLNRATPRQVAQAIRIGPYVMPRFGAGELSEGQVDSLARYVQSIQHPDNRGGWGLGRIGPIPEGMVAWLLAAASLLLIARLIGERMPDQRDERAERTGAAHE